MGIENHENRLGASDFATTQWSIVLDAVQKDSHDAETALATLCERYWFPLYAYTRRRVKDVAQAQDLTQEFFARLVEKQILLSAVPERGRFRCFLLTAVKNFLANEWKKAHAQKRGGRAPLLSLDFRSGDSLYDLEPSHELTAERLFERKWALTLLDRALAQLRDEYAAEQKSEQFELLRHFIGGDPGESSYATVAARLNMTQGAVKVAAHRLRRRYRELLRNELSHTVADPADVDDEISWLFKALE